MKKIEFKKKIKFNFIELALLVLLPCLLVGFVSASLVYNKINKNGKVLLTNDKNVNEFISVYNKLVDNYYEDLDKNELVDAAISGMLSYTGDDYTIYMDEDATEELNDKLEGTYDGIGIRISLNDNNQIYVYEVFDDTPAMEAGILKDDILTSINGVLLDGKSTSDASEMIKTSEDKNVSIGINRNGENLEFNLSVKNLVVPAITSSIKEINGKKIGYIYLETFSSTLDTQVEKTLITMESEGISSLILDVRGNTGGYLSSCTNIINLFLEKGKLMYSIKSKKSNDKYYDDTDTKRDYPIVILVDGSSASASEILAGSLKYSYGATLVGTKTYGKGKVQTTGTLDDGTMIKYTTATWLMPNGNCIDEKGITPDYVVKLSDDYANNPIEENDDQLNKAIEILSN